MTTERRLSAELRNAAAELAADSGGQRLLHLALDAVQTVDPAELRRASALWAPLNAPMLLTLLTWCYARGLYDSRDIVAAAPFDRTIRYVCKGTRLHWEILRSFRRKHRALLLQCLRWVLTQAWRLKLEETQRQPLSADWFESQLATFIAREAVARLEVAASLDTAAAD